MIGVSAPTLLSALQEHKRVATCRRKSPATPFKKSAVPAEFLDEKNAPTVCDQVFFVYLKAQVGSAFAGANHHHRGAGAPAATQAGLAQPRR